MLTKLTNALIKVNKEYFSFAELPSISISQGQQKIERRSIVFGTYNIKNNSIRIHPILLQENVPEYALEFVIYHELLHYQDRKDLLVRKKGTKVHNKEFKNREKQFIYYHDAKKTLTNLLNGKTMKKNKTNSITSSLRGESLENALTESLQRLEQVLIKYNMIEEKTKGAKRGTKKTNDQNQLVSDV